MTRHFGVVLFQPVITSIIYVPEGYTLTLDVSDLYFRVWIIEGTLKFDTTMDITMEAEYIIVNGVNAHFTIGSSDAPYEKRKSSSMDTEIFRSPNLGLKLAMTSGRLTFTASRWCLGLCSSNRECR